jgi:hypothetical protein
MNDPLILDSRDYAILVSELATEYEPVYRGLDCAPVEELRLKIDAALKRGESVVIPPSALTPPLPDPRPKRRRNTLKLPEP